VIALDAVSKGYGGQGLLRDVSWRIGRGERIGLCGPNGTGKTTLCRILAGVEEADDGRVHRFALPGAPRRRWPDGGNTRQAAIRRKDSRGATVTDMPSPSTTTAGKNVVQ